MKFRIPQPFGGFPVAGFILFSAVLSVAFFIYCGDFVIAYVEPHLLQLMSPFFHAMKDAGYADYSRLIAYVTVGCISVFFESLFLISICPLFGRDRALFAASIIVLPTFLFSILITNGGLTGYGLSLVLHPVLALVVYFILHVLIFKKQHKRGRSGMALP
jgi:hypothetical protein